MIMMAMMVTMIMMIMMIMAMMMMVVTPIDGFASTANNQMRKEQLFPSVCSLKTCTSLRAAHFATISLIPVIVHDPSLSSTNVSTLRHEFSLPLPLAALSSRRLARNECVNLRFLPSFAFHFL
jgi:hypothetical protein